MAPWPSESVQSAPRMERICLLWFPDQANLHNVTPFSSFGGVTISKLSPTLCDGGGVGDAVGDGVAVDVGACTILVVWSYLGFWCPGLT